MEVRVLQEEAPRLSSRAMEDYDLVLTAIDGNQKAYDELLERYRPAVYSTILKMVNNREDADDLTIEAFGKAFHKLPSYAPRYAFSTWLFKIAINNCIDHIRKKRIQALSIDDTLGSDSDSDYKTILRGNILDPEEKFIRDQRIQLIRKTLAKLSPKYRTMIELRYFEEFSYEEIAVELSIPLGTVKAQLFRAKELMFEYLNSPQAMACLEITSKRDVKEKLVVLN
jgi:RNA polymerase sigma factor (sigma-70 family)